MYKLSVVLFVLAVFCLHCEARLLTRCELVRELRKLGFPKNQLRNWVCLIEAESGRNTATVGSLNTNGSRDWGIFQINDMFWCSKSNTAGNICEVKCTDLISDNIKKSADCAKIIYKRQKFKAWYGWVNKCKGKPLPNISKC